MRGLIAIFSFFAVAGCSRSLKQYYDEDGVLTLEVNCSGRDRTMGDCYAHASQYCRGKYKILGRGQNDDFTSTAYVQNGVGYAAAQNNYGRAMTFRCETPPPGSAATSIAAPAPSSQIPEPRGAVEDEDEQARCLREVKARRFPTMSECRCALKAKTNAELLECR